jgi:CheY-like chemotaxis protein
MFVEDNPDDIEIARRAFKQSDLVSEVMLARDGQDVIDKLQPERDEDDGPRPDLILLDLNLPRVNGFEVLERLRASERYRVVPVIVLSASARQEDVLRSYRLGANSYLQKPAVFEEFAELLEVMGRYWLQLVTLPPE